MPDGFPNRPRILRGAFIEYGLSLPPLFVVFQFNPEQLSRRRSQFFSVPGSAQTAAREAATQEGRDFQYLTLRDLHQRYEDLEEVREAQQVQVQEESINFELRLDATDDLAQGDPIAGEFGIGPRLATLELMVHPKSESLLGGLVDGLLGAAGGFSFTGSQKPPMVLFVWGRTRVVPVNINSLSISETEFNTVLAPVRATASVSLTVIEGKSPFYLFSRGAKEVQSLLNLANITEIADVVVPG
jgi:hypothetical protein